jgi:hypothetical protein
LETPHAIVGALVSNGNGDIVVVDGSGLFLVKKRWNDNSANEWRATHT